MPEVICQMCGKPNPDDLENCQFCQARLKPLGGAQTIQPGKAPVKSDTAEFDKVNINPDEEPIRPGQVPTKKNTSELERALPSWLRAVRGQEDGQAAAEQPVPSPEERQPAGSSVESPGEEFPDWLAGLRTESTKDADDEVPEWLANLRGKISTEAPDDNEKPEEKDRPSEINPKEAEKAQAEPAPAADDLREWLASLKSEGQGAAATEAPSTGISEEPIEPKPAHVEGELPDWLAGLMSPEPGLPAEEATLAGIEETPEEPEPLLPAADLPDWLATMKPDEKPSQDAGETLPAADIAPGAIPDWLADLKPQAAGSAEDVINVPEGSSKADEELPDWLTEAQPETARSVSDSGLKPTSAVPSEPAPDWLADLQAEPAQAVDLPGGKPAFGLELEEIPSDKSQPAEALPDWLAGIAAVEVPSGSEPVLEDDEQAVPDKQAEAAFSMDAPDWLSTLKPEEKVSKQEVVPAQDNSPAESLEPGELPSWVQAMRPVESAVGDARQQDRDEQTIERRGPLAGLSGVLPAEPGLGPLRKPPAYSNKLYTNENQMRHAEHLEQMVAGESRSGQVVKPAGMHSTRILRWMLSAILIVAVFVPILAGSQTVPPFSGYPSEMGPTISLIDGLPVNAPVLLVFDYEAAFTGEMEAAGGPLIDYLLITKGPRLAMVSTLPAGPALAGRFMRSIPSAQSYQAGQQYIQLGYISGGTSGVLSFIQNPLAAKPVLFNGQNAWDLPPLAGVGSLSDFSLLIILTDSADMGRVWVEQTAQYLNVKPPMVMVVSAQAEPMVRPYFDAKQIQGLVVGLAGGLSFEAVARPGTGRVYWDAFSFGLLAAEILIVVGGIWSIVAGISSRKKNPKEGES